MAAIHKALFCAGIFIMVGFVYWPDFDSRYRLGVSVIGLALCTVTSMQFMSIAARILIGKRPLNTHCVSATIGFSPLIPAFP